jgi:beta-lactamase regulating signal transducer with metallopeptidase domain
VTAHLLFSTAVLVAAMAAARFLPLTARTRYVVLFCGLVKFAVPTAIFDLVPIEAVPQPLRVFGGAAAAPVAPSGAQMNWLLIAWGALALLVFTRWALLRTRTIAAALRSPAAPSQRELEALREARNTLRVHSAIDLLRSPICEAPAVLRVLRPVVVLPARGCDDLDDDELRSLLLHESAHVARHDNLASFVQALATSLLWFHPLVWLASRQLSAAREEACDEAVAAAMAQTDSYVSALLKICHHIAAPRPAGASCMASSNLNQRMEHLMSYESIRKRAWSHRAIFAAGILVIALSTVAATPAAKTDGRYGLRFTCDPSGPKHLTFRFDVLENGKTQYEAELRVEEGKPGSMRRGMTNDGREVDYFIEAAGTQQHGQVRFEVREDGKLVQQQIHTYDKSKVVAAASDKRDPITLNLKNANLKDLMNTFSDLTGYEVAIDREAENVLVTMNVHGVPWDEVLNMIARENGLKITIEGKMIRVSK